MAKAAKVSELKAGLSKYLARVKRGEEVVVTERGKPIAKLVPIPPAQSDEMARMRELERQGRVIIRGSGRIPDDFFDRPRPTVPFDVAVRAVLEEREEGW